MIFQFIEVVLNAVIEQNNVLGVNLHIIPISVKSSATTALQKFLRIGTMDTFTPIAKLLMSTTHLQQPLDNGQVEKLRNFIKSKSVCYFGLLGKSLVKFF